jgi:acyl carrier protein
MDSIRSIVRQFLLNEFLPGEDSELLTDTTPLVTGGILDSIATMKLAAFLEEQFGITLQAHEMSVDHLNTITNIVQLVQSKQTT